MTERKMVRKWFWAWEFDKEEQWLNDMAAQGLALVDVGFCRYEFEECPPGEYQIRLELLENDDDIPEIPCDPQRMRQVFLNILDNAAKHGGDGKRIEASMEMEDDEVVVRIRDYGHSIPEDELPLVKKKFYKGSTKVRGTGIGLAVCDEIIALHSGELTLENAPDGGTIVTVRLPVTQ